MPSLTDTDVGIAVVIALIILLVVLCGWPGLLRVRARDLAGYWAGASGTLHAIQPVRDHPHHFSVTTSTGGTSTVASGRVDGLRSLTILGLATPGSVLSGSVDLSGRRIAWSDGTAWTLQGVR